jgi:hypothetical protein
MLNPHAKLTLGRERQNILLAEAQAARQARQARQARWWRRSGAARGTPVTGSSLVEYEIMLEHTMAHDREGVCC